MADLLEHVVWSAVEALNVKPEKPLANALKQGYREQEDLVLESDTDEQLLIHIPFQQAARISGIIIKSAAAAGQAPLLVKLFVNRPTIGFAEALDSHGVQALTLTEKELAGEVVPLQVVKFSRVNCLTIFVESNQGDEETTVVQKLAVLGTAGDKMDVKEIKDVSKEGNA